MSAPGTVRRGLDATRGASPLVLRIVPLQLYAGRGRVIVERALRTSKAFKWTIISGFFEPVFYLVAMGAGLGSLIGTVETASGPVSYAAFIAPGLLATSAMNGAVYDSTINIFFKMRYARTYEAMLATSLGPLDVAIGEISWALIRGAIYATAFEFVMLAMGLIESPWAVFAVPCAVLIAFGFAAVGMAITTWITTFQQLDWVTTLLLPMFLFSTTFFPLDVYPRGIQIFIQCFPLYHGIELMRGFTLGDLNWGLVGHATYFVVMAVVGVAVASRRLEKLLLR